MKMILLDPLIKNKKIFFIIFIVLNFNLFSSELDVLYNKLTQEYGEFGFVTGNPQNGDIKVTYNNDLIYFNKYCPGSLLKPFALVAYSKTNEIDQYKSIKCLGDKNKEISCWLRKGHGELNLVKAIAHSCNYYFYFFLKDKLNKNAYIDVLNEFGIFYTDNDFKVNQNDFIKLSFGLNEKYLVYPIDILMAYSSIFNGGILYDRNKNRIKKIKVNDELIDIILQGMKESYLYGTSQYILSETKIVDVFAKTGTGPYEDIIDNSWNSNTGWVILFYPIINPEFGLMVIVKKGGSSAACKIAVQLLNYFNKK